MICNIIIPEDTDVHISVPIEYVGRKVEVIMFASDEPATEKLSLKKTVASFRGALKVSTRQYTDLKRHLKKIREEWE